MNHLDFVIVDDSSVILFLHSQIISMAGYGENTPTFEDGSKVIQYLLQRKASPNPLLILLDINMPVSDGWDVLEVLPYVEGNNNIYVAMVTSSVDQVDKVKAYTYPHVIAYVEKPINEKLLRDVIEKLFNGKQ